MDVVFQTFRDAFGNFLVASEERAWDADLFLSMAAPIYLITSLRRIPLTTDRHFEQIATTEHDHDARASHSHKTL